MKARLETRTAQYALRRAIQPALRGLLQLTTRLHIEGSHNIPSHGAAIIVFNHLGHLDAALVVAFSPRPPEWIALADLANVPGLNLAMRAYGVILAPRGECDPRVIRVALDALKRGDVLALAPEGRQSPTAALEKGHEGAAYLALKSNTPVVPIGITGTQNVYSAWRACRRPDIRMTVGAPFHLPPQPGARWRKTLETAHGLIMKHIAQLLPAEYHGYWENPESPQASTQATIGCTAVRTI